MTRKFRSTRKFDKQLKALDPKIIKQASKAIELFIKDPTHPSLGFKKIQGTKKFYEVRVNMSIRIIIDVNSKEKEQVNTFYIIGKHEEVFQVE